MEQENFETELEQVSQFKQVTPLSKYLAMILFILMPFIGGWIGYHYAPEKIVEVEKVVLEEVTAPVPISNIFSLSSIEVGGTYGTMVVESVLKPELPAGDIRVEFSGTVTLVGSLTMPTGNPQIDGGIGPDYSISNLTDESIQKMPKMDTDGRAVWFGIENPEIISGTDLVNRDRVEVVIDTYRYVVAGTTVWNSAYVVSIKKIEPDVSQKNEESKEGSSPISIVLTEDNAEWEIGGSYLIRWTDDKNVSEDDKYHVHLFDSDTGERTTISIGRWGDNELYYTVNNLMSTPPGKYLLKICDHPVCEEGAISHGVTVNIGNKVNDEASITIINPKGDNVWKRGGHATIQWVDSGNIPDESQYSVAVTDKSGEEYGVLSHTITGTSDAWFDVGTLQDGSELSELRPGEVAYYIKVVDKSNPDNHSLINSPLAAFVITD